MFQEWGFLLGEIWVLLALAALVGLIAGWIIWGRSSKGAGNASLQSDLDACRAGRRSDAEGCAAKCAEKNARIAELETQLAMKSDSVDYDGDGVLEGENEGVKPATLTAARNGKPDDLKQIKGIGLKLEKLCNTLGFYHFDQIAAWTPDEMAWVDANLEGFKGRVTRDTWVPQAKILAAGGETEFSKKVEKGGVYE